MARGDELPRFVMRDEYGEEVDSSGLRGLRFVVHFYSDDTGCLEDLGDFFPKFAFRNVLVFGVSPRSPDEGRELKDRLAIKVKLLSDPGGKYAESLGVPGKAAPGNVRATFLVGKDGRIEAEWEDVPREGHVQRVLDEALSFFRKDVPGKLDF